MKVAKIQSARAFSVKNHKSLGVQAYDAGNDYPQKVMEIVAASGTGSACVRTYARFIYGHGFNDTAISGMVANRRGETLDYVLKQVCRDYAMFNGFALHLNYNAMHRVAEIYHVPFEHCRFEAKDKETGRFNRVGIYDDWTHYDLDRKAVKKEMVDFIPLFDPEALAGQVEAAGGWESCKGQVYYHSGSGGKEYPAPIFAPELTNMRAEEGLDNVVSRNVTCSFMPGSVIVDVCNDPESAEQLDAVKREFREFQGDESTGNVMLVQVRSEAEIPRKIDLKGENYDKEFTATQAYLPDAIGRVFTQPPILRAEDVTTGFATDEMVNAYNYYNSQTVDARQDVSAVFARIFALWGAPGAAMDAEIAPLTYNTGASVAEQLGPDVTRAVIDVVADARLSRAQKLHILTGLYNFDAVEAVKYVGPETARPTVKPENA